VSAGPTSNACKLPANVLLALSWPHHLHHRAAQRWFS
jgi:hypothetical protein